MNSAPVVVFTSVTFMKAPSSHVHVTTSSQVPLEGSLTQCHVTFMFSYCWIVGMGSNEPLTSWSPFSCSSGKRWWRTPKSGSWSGTRAAQHKVNTLGVRATERNKSVHSCTLPLYIYWHLNRCDTLECAESVYCGFLFSLSRVIHVSEKRDMCLTPRSLWN